MTRAAFKEAMTRPISEIAAQLQELLGQRLVAFAVGVRSPKLVGRWAAGDHEPRDEPEKRLRELYRAVLILRDHYGAETIRAFMVGANPDLEDRAPIDVLHDGRGAEVVRAAESFINE
jgi:hypothetical protein